MMRAIVAGGKDRLSFAEIAAPSLRRGEAVGAVADELNDRRCYGKAILEVTP